MSDFTILSATLVGRDRLQRITAEIEVVVYGIPDGTKLSGTVVAEVNAEVWLKLLGLVVLSSKF